MYNFYYKPLLQQWFQLIPDNYKSSTHFKNIYQSLSSVLFKFIKNKKIRDMRQISTKQLIKKGMPKILLTKYFIKNKQMWKKYVNILKGKCHKILTMRYGRKPYFFKNKKFIQFWRFIKKGKQKDNLTKANESRKLKWIKKFYRNFGFRRNKNRTERPLMRTKKFKKFMEYNQILKLLRHKKIFRKYTIYQIQSCRIKGPSYYKIHKQLFLYWKKNYLPKNFTRRKIANITTKVQRLKKEKLVSFVSHIELTLNSLLLRMRLLNTTGLIHQFIKHGNVYINYKKVLSPAYLIKPGDTISIYINSHKQKYHRFHDPLYTSYFMPGLYRKHTGRLSLIINEKSPEFVKMSLNALNIWRPAQFSSNTLVHLPKKISKEKIKPTAAIFQLIKKQSEKKIQKKKINQLTPKITAWKVGFLYKKIPNIYTQQNKSLLHMHKNIA